jgi:hypothetical protein
MSRPLCGIGYQRPDGALVKCTYLAGHPDPAVRCSWFGVKAQDNVDEERTDYTPQAVQAVLDALVGGDLDPYVEAILAAGHARKRMLRGERGFVRLSVEEERPNERS